MLSLSFLKSAENLGMSIYRKSSTATTAGQESTRHTPFEVMFGRRGSLPIDFNTVASYNPDDKLKEFVQVSWANV